MDEDSSCKIPGVPRDPIFTGDFSFNTGQLKQTTPYDYIMLVVTLVISLLISVYFAWKSDLHMDLDEYLLAKRSMNSFPVGFSLLASFLSAVLLIGVPAEMYNFNITYVWIIIPYFLMSYLAANVFVPVFFKMRLTTVYEYLEKRFGRAVRTGGSCLFLIQTVFYMAIVLYTPSVVFNRVSGLSLWGSILSVGIVSTLYTTLSGIKAVMWTDCFQVIVMFVSLVVMLLRAMMVVGSFDVVYESAVRTNRITFWDFRLDPTIRITVWSLMTGEFLVHMSIFGVNHSQIHRCLSCRTLKDAQIAIWMNVPYNCVFLYLCCMIGLYMSAFYENCDPIEAKLIRDSNELLPLFSMDILSDTKGLVGLILAGLFSGSLSTVSSGLNSAAAVILEDYIKIYVKYDIKQHRARLISQIISLVFGAVCLEFTYLVSKMGPVLEAVNSMLGMMAAPNLGVFILGLFFPWTNAEGAMAGLVCSISVMIWIKVGTLVNEVPSPKKALTCVRNCNISMFPVESQISFQEMKFTHETVDPSEINFFYRISYHWYPLLAVLVCITIGLIVSCATGFQDPQKLDPRLIVSMGDDVFPFYYLPERIKKYSRYGMDHKGKFDRTPSKKQHSDEFNRIENTETSRYKPSRMSMDSRSLDNPSETEL